MADEVDTDDELREAEAAAAAPAEEVATDDELTGSSLKDSPAHVLWGEYEPARLKSVQQGMYQVRFEDGATRWATCGELVLSDARIPLQLLQDGMPILRPEKVDDVIDFAPAPSTARSGKSTPRVKTSRQLTKFHLKQGRLKRRVPEAPVETWEVQLDDAEGTLSTHSATELRLPVAYGLMLGGGGRLTVGTRLHALRGHWRPCTLHGGGSGRASQMRGRAVTVDLGNGSTVRTWVGGGQIINSEPADPAALLPGTRAVAHVPAQALKPYVEVQIVDVGPSGADAVCVDDKGKELQVSLLDLHTRLDIAFRVLAASAGFQRAKVVDFTPDGMYACEMAGGAVRWVSACEMTTAAHTAAELGVDKAQPLTAGTFVAVTPAGGVGDARWLSGALVVDPPGGKKAASKGTVTLRRPRIQKPLTLTVARRDGRFGIGLDENNRVLELKPGCAAIDAGVAIGDKICRVDGVVINSAEDLATNTQGKEVIELEVSADRDGGEGGGDADGDGEVDDGEDGFTWTVPLAQVLLPLLARGTTAGSPVT